MVRVRGGYQRYGLDYHPLDVVGWDGYVYPYTFNIDDFEPIAGRVHMPPPVHQTFQGPNFVICSFCPRMLDWAATARDPDPLQPLQPPVRGDDLLRLRRRSARAGDRRGIDHAASVRAAPRAAARAGREVDRAALHRRAGGDVRHVPAAAADRRCARDIDDGRYALSWADDSRRLADGRRRTPDVQGSTAVRAR